MLITGCPGSQAVQKYRWEKINFTTILNYRRAECIGWFRSSGACMGRFGRGWLPVRRWERILFLEVLNIIDPGTYFAVPSIRLVPRTEALVVVDDYGWTVLVNHVFNHKDLGSWMKVLGSVVRSALSIDGYGVCWSRVLYTPGFSVPRVRVGYALATRGLSRSPTVAGLPWKRLSNWITILGNLKNDAQTRSKRSGDRIVL